MTRIRSLALGTLWVALSLLAPRASAAQAEPDADVRAPRFLLAVAGARKPLDVRRTPVLSRHIALDLKGETLAEALAAITRRSGLRLAYTEEVLPPDARVHLQASQISVAGALSTVLLDAGVDVVFTSGGQASLVRRLAVAPPAVGSIVGRVTDAKTGQGLDGAEVLLEGTKWRTLADQDGQYRLAEIEIGSYTLVARRIGYGRQARAVTVMADQELTADFALQPTPTRLEEVVVTGTVIPTEVKALPTPITVITAEDLERQHVRRIEEAIRLAVPGAVAWEPAGTNPSLATMQLSLRGASGLLLANPKMYIDGIEASVRQFQIVDPQSIERIEVVRGPQAAAIYGSDAMGGVIQVFTKRGGATQRPEVEAQAAVGLIESDFVGSGALRQEYSAAVRGQAGSASYRVGGGYSRTGDWLPYYRNSIPSVNGGLRIAQGPLSFDLSARYYEQNAETAINPLLLAAAPSLVSDRPPHTPFQGRQETYAARLEYRPAAWWQHSVTAGIDRYSFSQAQLRARLTTPADTFLFVGFQQTPKLSLAYQTAVAAPLGAGLTATVTAGVDHWRVASDFFSATTLTTTGVLQIVPGAVFANRSRTTNTGLFAQTQVNIHETFFLTGAVRGEWNSGFGDASGVPIAPRVGLSYVHQLGATTLKLRGAYGEAIRPPNPGAREGTVSSFLVIQPNPLLKPERQIGPDFGLDLVFGRRGSFSVTHYRQIAKDLITTVTLDAFSTPPVYQVQNVARVRNIGWEFEGSLQVGPLALTGQYAITQSRAGDLGPSFSGDIKVGEQLFGVPRHTAAATLTATPLRRTSITAGLAYTGTWRDYDFLAYFGCLGGTGPCQGFLLGDYLTDYPAFATLNLSIEQQLSRAVSSFLAVEDLTNTGSGHARARNSGSPVPGRIVTGGARVRY